MLAGSFQRAEKMLSDFRRRQSEAIEYREHAATRPKSRPRTGVIRSYSVIPRMVVSAKMFGAHETLYVHRRAGDVDFSVVVVSFCRTIEKTEAVHLSQQGPDPFWFRPQPNDWWVRDTATVQEDALLKVTWRGKVLTDSLHQRLSGLLPR